ncbi:hypothetical protein TWF281_011669 [Arthrobotrys megalospora]
MITVLQGCSGNIAKLYLGYSVGPAQQEDDSGNQVEENERNLWNLPKLEELRVDYIGFRIEPLSWVLDKETLLSVKAFYFISFQEAEFEEVVESVSALINVETVVFYTDNGATWKTCQKHSRTKSPEYEQFCSEATELLGRALGKLHEVKWISRIEAEWARNWELGFRITRQGLPESNIEILKAYDRYTDDGNSFWNSF